jgi:hypothetical protein
MSEMTTSPRPSAAGLAAGVAGITPPSDPNRQGAFLTDVIVELGLAGQEHVDEAIDSARRLAKTPERYLLETGAIDERQLSLAVAERNGLDHVDLDLFEVDPEATGLIDKPVAARYSALPIAFAPDGALLVAIDDPCDMLGISDIEVMTRNEVRPVIATGAQIQALIERLPDRASPPATDWEQTPNPEAEPDPPLEAQVAPPLEAEPDPPLEAQVAPPLEAEPDPPLEAQAAPPLEAEPAPQPEAQAAPPPVAVVPEPPAESDTSEPDDGDDTDLGELSAALAALAHRMRQAGDLARTAERRINELEDVDEQAQRAAAALDDERAEFEQERQASAERERQLDAELTAARERIAALEHRQSELAAAAELAKAATEQLAELQRILQE